MEKYSEPLKSSCANLRPQITIREACEVLGYDLPNENNTDSLEYIDIDKPCTISSTTWSLREGAIVMLRSGGPNIYDAVKSHASMIIGDFAYRNTDAYSVKRKKNYAPKDVYAKLCRYIRDKYDIPSIAITGNAGKTTTKDLISSIFIHQMKTLCVQKNYNTWYTGGELLQNIEPDHKMYIQEVHEPHGDTCTKFIHADAVVLTNLERAHLNETGASLDQSIRATLKILDGMKSDGTVFANNDCPFLSKEKFEGRKVVRYSATSNECDYWAENIVNHGEYTTFTICSKKDPKIDAILNIAGIHNVNNAIAAYAVGRHFGVSAEDIVMALETYRPDGVRQNLMTVNDRHVLVDCYSTTVLSSVAAGRTLCELPLKPGGKRVMVLSYLPTLGAGTESVHRDVGRNISKLPVDLVIGYRNDAKYIIDECKKAGKEAVFFQYHKDVIEYLKKNLTEDDSIAFKGVTYAHLEQVANAVLGLDIKPENPIESDKRHNGGDF